MHANPYAADLGDIAPYQALSKTPWRIQGLLTAWSDVDFERSYAPGKWSARRILVHLAQTELALPIRARYALSQTGYVAQSFDQDAWLPLDDGAEALTALDAYLALRKMNLGMWGRLTEEQLKRPFTHPEYGELTVGWIMAQMAGHDLRHYRQLLSIK